MSVAFRRESDEEHREPRFELPLPPGPNLVTERGLALIRARVCEYEERVAAETDEAAREEAKRDLRYWRTRQSTAQLAPAPAGDEAAFGTCVTIRLNGEERTFAIVGHDEAEPAGGTVSVSAPLARAVLGAVAGDLLPFAGKDDAIEVLNVEAIS